MVGAERQLLVDLVVLDGVIRPARPGPLSLLSVTLGGQGGRRRAEQSGKNEQKGGSLRTPDGFPSGGRAR